MLNDVQRRSNGVLTARKRKTTKFQASYVPSFNPEAKGFTVPGFPESRALDVHRARFLLKGLDLFDIFEPVIDSVLKLVMDQIAASEAADAKVKAVLMVGGFGENTYLNERLRQALIDRNVGVWKTANA